MRVQGDVARANPGLPIKEISRKVGEQWRALPADEKQKHLEAAEKETSAWKNHLASWVDAHPNARIQSTSTLKAVTSQLKEKEAAKAPRKPRTKKDAGAAAGGAAIKKRASKKQTAAATPAQ